MNHPIFKTVISRCQQVTGSAGTETAPCTVGEALEEICSNTHQAAVEEIRALAGDKEGQRKAKVKLPAFLFSGSFYARRRESLEDPSGLIVLDFDGIEDAEGLRDRLAEHPYTVAAFVSPSGAGAKALVLMEGLPAGGFTQEFEKDFQAAWRTAAREYKETFGEDADIACKDCVRATFASWDPGLQVNENPKPLKFTREETQPKALEIVPPPRRFDDEKPDLEKVRELLSYIPRRPDYAEWIRIIAAVSDCLPFETACRALMEWSPEEEAGEYGEKIKSRLEEVSYKTLFHLAQQGGYQHPTPSRIRFAGKPLSTTPAALEEVEDNSELLKRVNELIIQNEVGAAEAVGILLREQWRFNLTSKKWMRFNRGKWSTDLKGPRLEISRLLKKHIFEVRDSVSNEIAKRLSAGEKVGKDHELRIHLRLAEKTLESVFRKIVLCHVTELAKDHLSLNQSDLDRDPLTLNLLNGRLDLRTFEIFPHRPDDMLSHQAAAAWDPEATSPRWDRFLNTVFLADLELIRFVQKLCGYAVSGLVDLDYLAFFYGHGANGKSTFIDVIRKILGDYASTVSIEGILIQPRGGRDPVAEYERAKLMGARLVSSSEIPDRRDLSEAAVKSLIGGDPIDAREPYGEPFSFDPTHKLFLVGNHKPDIKGTDHGIWRRVYLIPFNHRFTKKRERREVIAELMSEASGILNWLAEGFRLAKAEGLEPVPQVVREAVELYQAESDLVADFILEKCRTGSHEKIEKAKLYHAFQKFAEAAGERPGTMRWFTRRIEQEGIESFRTKSARYFQGITIPFTET
jgi:putative DNA primase/helicase